MADARPPATLPAAAAPAALPASPAPAIAAPAALPAAAVAARSFWGLGARMFAITFAAILFIEALIFLPSAANYRIAWLEERAAAARGALLAVEAAPDSGVSASLADRILINSELVSVRLLAQGEAVAQLGEPFPGEEESGGSGGAEGVVVAPANLDRLNAWNGVPDALRAFNASNSSFVLVRDGGFAPGTVVETLVPSRPLAEDLRAFCDRIVWLSLIIALAMSALISLLLAFLVVRPVRRLTRSVEQFAADPGAWRTRLPPTSRTDEIGRIQNAVSSMEDAVAGAFRHRARLAQLGEAVARINHDLRGSLATAQLVSDTLSRSQDERVQRAAPRLERALERAVRLATDTLEYGRTGKERLALQPVAVRAVAEDAADDALARLPGTELVLDVPGGARAMADRDALGRILANLVRNAAEAMNGEGRVRVSWQAADAASGPRLLVEDEGPGLPEAARANLFQAFKGTQRKGGTGLGLAIAHDLAEAMGGALELDRTGADGTRFSVSLQAAPDEVVAGNGGGEDGSDD